MKRPASLSLIFLATATQALAGPGVGPNYSKIVTVIESQPVNGAQLIYWDQSTADAMGIHVPPGRVGLPEFDQAVLKKIGYEIKQGAQVISNPSATRDGASNPLIFVEDDAFGGSGRAGYIEVEPGIWANIKGLGKTGAGHTRNAPPSPPANVFQSHQDGSATTEESIKETIDGRVADSELSRGGDRVLAIFYTGRTIRYPDGKEVPLAEIVRAPMRRLDQPGGQVEEAAQSLGEANAKRILKGDFVNKSNLGTQGEFIDYGTMTFTEGYSPLKSSQPARFLFEDEYFHLDQTLYRETLSKGLLTQMGIPESQLEAIGIQNQAIKSELKEMADSFIKAVYWVEGQPNAQAPATVLDFEHVDWNKLRGNVRFQEFFREAAKNYYATPAAERETVFHNELQRLLSMTSYKDDDLVNQLSDFLRKTHDFFEKVASANHISDRAEYGKKLEQIAQFKNRDIADIVRPRMFSNAGTLADQYVRDHNPQAINTFIENTVQGNRFETSGVADNAMIASANEQSTQIHVRAFKDSTGTQKLFAFPDLSGAKEGEEFYFRVTTDGWATQKDFPAKFVSTKVGTYFVIDIPHGSMPVTHAQVELVPFVKESGGGVRFIGDNINLRGPPMVFNERIGLPSSFSRKPGVMREKYNMLISIDSSADMRPLADGATCDPLLRPVP